SALPQVVIVRDGKKVTLQIPSMQLMTIQGLANVIHLFSDDHPLPEQFKTSEAIEFGCTVIEDGKRKTGLIIIDQQTVSIMKTDGSTIQNGFTTNGFSLNYISE